MHAYINKRAKVAAVCMKPPVDVVVVEAGVVAGEALLGAGRRRVEKRSNCLRSNRKQPKEPIYINNQST
jgi:hypothetical protein